MDFFNQTGKMAIGSRLRMLTDKITMDAASIYEMFGVDLKPKWFPVFFVLSQGEAKTITSTPARRHSRAAGQPDGVYRLPARVRRSLRRPDSGDGRGARVRAGHA